MFRSARRQWPSRLALKINNYEIPTRIQNLAQMEITVTSNSDGLRIPLARSFQPGQQESFRFEHKCRQSPVRFIKIMEAATKQSQCIFDRAYHSIAQRLPIVRTARLRHERRVDGVLRQGEM
jgi:hypothetical protein